MLVEKPTQWLTSSPKRMLLLRNSLLP
ncbi:hypothetical protein Golob_027306, partial [Gossypium lobatum]|nr:hypothetical protein [Gossypium lobatum]